MNKLPREVEPKTNKVLLTLDENKELSINIKKADEAEQDLMIETIKELWGCVE